MDDSPAASHRFAARFARPGLAALSPVNPLRGFSSPTLPTNKNAAPNGAALLLVDRVRTNWNHLVNDLSEWSEVLANAFPETENRLSR